MMVYHVDIHDAEMKLSYSTRTKGLDYNPNLVGYVACTYMWASEFKVLNFLEYYK